MAKKKGVFGLSSNTAAALSYFGLWATGLLFFFLEKEDKFVRFHARQSVAFFGALTALFYFLWFFSLIPFLERIAIFVNWVLAPFGVIGGFVIWLFLIIKAYQGEKYLLPFIGRWAKGR